MLKKFTLSAFLVLAAIPSMAAIGTIVTQPSGDNGEVQFNRGGRFGSDPDLSFSTSTNKLSVSSMTATWIQGSTAAFNQIKWADGTTQTTAGGAGGGDAYLGNTQTFTAPQTWVSSATFQDQAFSVGGSTLMTTSGNVSVGNNLGIGLSNPTVRLQINTPGLDLGFNNTGFLGIGTTNAGQALEISGGNAYIGGFITATGTGTVSGNAFSVGGSSFAVSGGKVGAGTSSPAYTLQVASAAGSSGTIFAVTTGAVAMIQLQGDGDVLANRFIGDGSQLTGLAGGGDAVLSATQTFSGNDTFNIPRGSTMTFNGNMKSTGVFEAAYLQGDGSRLTGIASGGGDAYLGSTQTFTAPQTFRSSVTVTNQGFSVGTSTFAVKNGLVGVGTSSPSYGFHVATGAYFEQGAEFGGALGAWTSPGTQFQIGVNGSVPLTLYSASMTVVGSTFVVRETGNIGIGTTNPSQRLVIAGGAGANVAVIQSSGGSVGLNITASDALGGYTAIGPTTNNPFFLQSNNLTRMTVGADGRVGVSTTSPVAALAVGGGITTSSTITAQGGFYGDGANLTNLTAANVSAGSLGGSVIASSITLAAMYGAPTLTGTNFSGVANTALDSSSVTKQGNTFNAANKLVLLNGSGELPALSAANLTSIPWGNLSGVPAGFADGVDDTSAGGGDNLGNHTATTTLLMAGFDIDNADSVTMASGTVTGANFSVGDSTFVVKAGQIGLGTTAPTATTRLDVSGTTMLRNTVYFSTNSSYNLGYNAALNGWYWAAPANQISYLSTNQRLSIANDSSATTGGGGTNLNLTTDKIWTVNNSTAGTGGQAVYVALNGAFGWGTHINMPTAAVGALGYVVGVHGADQHGNFIAVDSTSGRGISLFQSAATTVTPLLDIRAETIWQSAAYLMPTTGPSYSGTQSGPLMRALVRGTTEFMVAANGDTTIGGTLTATAFSGNGNALTAISTASLNATGTPSGTTYLRGDNTWATVSGSGDAVLAATQTWTGGNTKNSWTVFSGSVTFSSTTVSSNISTTSYTNQWVDFGAGSTVTIRGGLRDQNNSFGTMNYSALVSSGSDGVAWAPRALFGTIYSSTAASTSTSTYANAPTALGFAVVSGSTYTFSYDLSVGCSGTGGLRVGLIGPTITSVRTKAWGNGSATALIVFSTGSLTTSGGIGSMSTPFNTTNSTTGRVFVAGQIVPSADGFVQLVFSPVTSGQTATIYEGTTMQVWRRQ